MTDPTHPSPDTPDERFDGFARRAASPSRVTPPADGIHAQWARCAASDNFSSRASPAH